LDWIAEHGGMALIDTHPDYMALDGSSQKTEEYPIELYKELLDYIRLRYSGEYWPALPRQVAAHCSRVWPNPRTTRRIRLSSFASACHRPSSGAQRLTGHSRTPGAPLVDVPPCLWCFYCAWATSTGIPKPP